MSKPNTISCIYDIEVWNNLFLVGYKTVGEDEIKRLRIGLGQNDLDEILSLFSSEGYWFFGYNNSSYDDAVIDFLFENYGRFYNAQIDDICLLIHKESQRLITSSSFFNKKRSVFRSIDLMKVGNIRKSLKMVAINLKWKKIQELPFHYTYTVKESDLEQIYEYNDNDVYMTEALFEHLRDEINMRASISKSYKVNVLNEADSGIANKLLEKLYSEKTKRPVNTFRSLRTNRSTIELSNVISKTIKFKTDHMVSFLNKMKSMTITPTSKFSNKVRINSTVYVLGQGGLHSENSPEVIKSSDDIIIMDADVSSYYPRIMINHNVYPKHLSSDLIPLLEEITNRRLVAKATGDKVTASALKITVNSIFGKTGYEHHWLYDPLAMNRVTVNGQLYLLMLIERLEMNGIKVFYANTDGVTASVPVNKLDLYNQLCEDWQKETNFSLEFVKFKKCVIRDVNNFLMIQEDGYVKMKGALDTERWKTLTKSFDKPIISIAIRDFFENEVSIRTTIMNHKDLLDFCMAQKPGSAFDVVFDEMNESIRSISRSTLQQSNRYYVSKSGGSIKKIDKNGKEISMVSGETVVVLNDYEDKDYPLPKYEWYIKEAQKIIYLFESKQIDLF